MYVCKYLYVYIYVCIYKNNGYVWIPDYGYIARADGFDLRHRKHTHRITIDMKKLPLKHKMCFGCSGSAILAA